MLQNRFLLPRLLGRNVEGLGISPDSDELEMLRLDHMPEEYFDIWGFYPESDTQRSRMTSWRRTVVDAIRISTRERGHDALLGNPLATERRPDPDRCAAGSRGRSAKGDTCSLNRAR